MAAKPTSLVERMAVAPNRYLWTPRAIARLGTRPDLVVARKIGVSKSLVSKERLRRGIACYWPIRPRIEWSEEMVAVLGTDSDAEVARMLGLPVHAVNYRRRMLGIEPYMPPARARQGRRWRAWELRLLGKVPDPEVARRLRVSVSVVVYKRRCLGIPSCGNWGRRIEWTPELVAALGRISDAEIARRYRISKPSIQAKRQELWIAPFQEENRVVRRPELAKVARMPAAQASRQFGVSESFVRALRAEYRVEGEDGRYRWTPELLSRLGTVPDAQLAAELDLEVDTVGQRRRKERIPALVPGWWRPEEVALLGTEGDREVAARLGRSLNSVRVKRRLLGIASSDRDRPWPKKDLALLGTAPDAEVAMRVGRSIGSVRRKRYRVGVVRYRKHPRPGPSGRPTW